jgi:hypothetical protein
MTDKTPDPCGSDSSAEFDTADVVLHKPTNEHWLVAYVKGDRLAWCGWPEGEAKTEDCTLWVKATDEERHDLLQSMARMTGIDRRKVYAQERLAALSNTLDETRQTAQKGTP